MPIHSGTEALRQVPLFASLDASLLGHLEQELVEAHFAPGQSIFQEGDSSSSLYAIHEGKVKVSRVSNGDEVVLAVFGPGDCFGELALCDGTPRSAAVIAMEPTTAYELSREGFLRFLESHPAAAIHFLSVMAARLRKTSDRLSEMLFLDLPVRLARRLEELARHNGVEEAEGVKIQLSMTADDLAPLVGGTPAQIAGELRTMDETGIIRWDGKSVTIRAPQLLAERTQARAHFVGLGHVTVPRWLLE
jgi:CRP/FNR family transcriptional regulator, cyclic AMP receptor protein